MSEAFAFWIMKPIAEAAVGLGIVAVLLLLYGLACLPGAIKRARCKHPAVYETGSCDAICRKCGKNLGFIGTWRKSGRSEG